MTIQTYGSTLSIIEDYFKPPEKPPTAPSQSPASIIEMHELIKRSISPSESSSVTSDGDSAYSASTTEGSSGDTTESDSSTEATPAEIAFKKRIEVYGKLIDALIKARKDQRDSDQWPTINDRINETYKSIADCVKGLQRQQILATAHKIEPYTLDDRFFS